MLGLGFWAVFGFWVLGLRLATLRLRDSVCRKGNRSYLLTYNQYIHSTLRISPVGIIGRPSPNLLLCVCVCVCCSGSPLTIDRPAYLQPQPTGSVPYLPVPTFLSRVSKVLYSTLHRYMYICTYICRRYHLELLLVSPRRDLWQV